MTKDWNWHVESLKSRLSELNETVDTIRAAVEDRPGLKDATHAISQLIGSADSIDQGLSKFPMVVSEILENSVLGAVLIGPAGKFLLHNQTAGEILGYNFILNRSDEALIFEDEAGNELDAHDLPWNRALEGESIDDERLNIKTDAQDYGKWITFSATPFTHNDDSVGGVMLFMLDTTEEVGIEESIESICSTISDQIAQVGSTQDELQELANKLSKTGVQRLLSDRQDTEAPSDSRPEQRRSKKSIARHTEEVESDLDVASTDDLSSPDSEVVESEYSSEDDDESFESSLALDDSESELVSQEEEPIEEEHEPQEEEEHEPIEEEMAESQESISDPDPDPETESEPVQAQTDQESLFGKMAQLTTGSTSSYLGDSADGMEPNLPWPEVVDSEDYGQNLWEEYTQTDETTSSSWEEDEGSEIQNEPDSQEEFDSNFQEYSHSEEENEEQEEEAVEEEEENDSELFDDIIEEEELIEEEDNPAEEESEEEEEESTIEANFHVISEEEEEFDAEQSNQYEDEEELDEHTIEAQFHEIPEEPQVQEHHEEPQAQEHYEEPQAQEHYEEPQAQEHYEEPQAQEHHEEPQVQEHHEEPQAQEDESVKGGKSLRNTLFGKKRQGKRKRRSRSSGTYAAIGGASELDASYLGEEEDSGESLVVNYSTTEEVEEKPVSNKILVVDDIPVNQKLLLLHLKRLGYEADVANNGKEALEAMAKEEYQVILMDCDMPVMNGFEAATKIRATEAYSHRRVPIIALTSYDRDGDRDKCLAAGMDDYITKGSSRKELKEAIDRSIVSAQEKSLNIDTVAEEEDYEADIEPLDINSMLKLYGKEEVEEISRLFLSNMAAYIECMQLAIDEKDADSVVHFSNAVKGPCAALGMKLMTKLTSDIIEISEKGDWTQVRVKYMRLKAVFVQTQDELKKVCPDDSLMAK